jgi:PAS domain-containing protein
MNPDTLNHTMSMNCNMPIHMNTASNDTTSMPSAHGPQHLAGLQQLTGSNISLNNAAHSQAHSHSHQGQSQDSNAVRTMSDVSSLSSSNGNTSPPNIHFQQTVSQQHSQNLHQQQQQQQQQNSSSTRQQTGAFQTWMIPNVLSSGAAGGGATNTATGIGTNGVIPNNTSQQSTFNLNPTKKKSNDNNNNNHHHHHPNNPLSPPSNNNLSKQQSSSSRGKGGGRKRRRDNQNQNHNHQNNIPQTTTSSKPSTNYHDFNIHASISEDEDEEQKRRRDRNMREQERSQRISNQITKLKELLAASNIPFKPDKYSTLVSVHSYIKSLQSRTAIVDSEHKKLVDTITKANELVVKAQLGPNATASGAATVSNIANDNSAINRSTTSTNANVTPQVIPSSVPTTTEEEEDLLQYVRGVDYKSVFSRTNIALCVLRIDGRLIDCNREFIRVSGLTKEELYKAGLKKNKDGDISPEVVNEFGKCPLSLFNLIAREDMQTIFEAMSEMLTFHTKEDGVGSSMGGGVGGAVGENTNDVGGTAVKMEGCEQQNQHLQQTPIMGNFDHWAGYIRRCHTSNRQVCFTLL